MFPDQSFPVGEGSGPWIVEESREKFSGRAVYSRQAFATLEEVRPAILLGPSNDETLTTAQYIALRTQVMALGSSGGVVSLPDGRRLACEKTTWLDLYREADAEGMRHDMALLADFGDEKAQREIVAAFNEREAVR